jgi:hypothetical protein
MVVTEDSSAYVVKTENLIPIGSHDALLVLHRRRFFIDQLKRLITGSLAQVRFRSRFQI